MCVAIYKPKNATVEFDKLQLCSETNPDGMGFAVRVKNKLLVHRQLDDFSSFFKLVNQYQNNQMIIHFRIGTHGVVSRQNCHPFVMNSKSIAFVHNGILSKYAPKLSSKVSDTVMFRKTMLEPLVRKYPEAVFRDKKIIRLLGEAIGSGNKLVLLDHKGNHSIINEDEETTIKGVWYSNENWRDDLPTWQFGSTWNYGNTGAYQGSKKYNKRSSRFKYNNKRSGYDAVAYDRDYPELETLCELCCQPMQVTPEERAKSYEDICLDCCDEILREQSGQLD